VNRVQRLSLLAIAAIFLLPAAGVAKEPSASHTPESIKKLVGDLDHDHYQSREKATAELVKIGSPAIAPMAAAFKGSAESQWRAITILQQIAISGEDAAYDEVIGMFESLPKEERSQTESLLVNLKERRVTQRNLNAKKLLQAKGGVFSRDDSPELAISFPGVGDRVIHASPYVPVSPSFSIPSYASPAYAPSFSPDVIEGRSGIILVDEIDGDIEVTPTEILEPTPVPSGSYTIPLPVEESLAIPEDVERMLEIPPAIEVSPEEPDDTATDFADPDVPTEDEAAVEPDVEGDEPPAFATEAVSGLSVFAEKDATGKYRVTYPIDIDGYDPIAVPSGPVVWEEMPLGSVKAVYTGPGIPLYGGGGFGGAGLPYPGSYARPQPQPDNVLVLSSEWRGDDEDLAAISSLAYVTHIVVEGLELSPVAIRSLFAAPSLRRVTLTNAKYGSVELEREISSHENVNVWTFGKAVLGVTGDPAAVPFQVATVHPETGATTGGIEPGDILLKVDGDELKDFSTLTRLVAGKMPGDKITVTVKRGEKTLDLSCILSNREKLTINQ